MLLVQPCLGKGPVLTSLSHKHNHKEQTHTHAHTHTHTLSLFQTDTRTNWQANKTRMAEKLQKEKREYGL